MKSYEIDFKNDVNLKEIKKLFLGNSFLHLKNILNINEITKIKDNVLNIDKLIDDSIDELINLLEKPIITIKDIEELKYLPLSFGKGQIFLSFSKK